MKYSQWKRKLEELGFVFPQGVFCTKGDMWICFDVYPYIAAYKKVIIIEFKKWDEFMSFYQKYSQL